MNIRKIIKEELDDFDWVRDTYDPLHLGLIYQTPNGNTLKIVKTNDSMVFYNLWDVDANRLYKDICADKSEVLKYINDGRWVMVNKMINESTEDDFDFINDTIPELHGVSFKVENSDGQIYTIKDKGYSFYVDVTWANDVGKIQSTPYKRSQVMKFFREGAWVLIV